MSTCASTTQKLTEQLRLFAVSLGCCILLGACAHLPVFGKSSVEDKTAPARTQSPESIKELQSVPPSLDTQQVEITQVLRGWQALPAGSPHTEEVILIQSEKNDSQSLLSLDRTGRLLYWSSLTARPRELLRPRLHVTAAALIMDRLLLALVTDANSIKLYSLASRTELASFEKLKSRVTSLAFMPDGSSLFMGGVDGKTYRWKGPDWNTGEMERYIGPATVVSAVALHPLGRVFFSGDWNGGLSAWLTYDSDLFEGKYDENILGGGLFMEKSVRQKGSRSDKISITDLAISANGKYLFCALQDGRIEVWQIRGFQKLGENEAHKGLIYSLDASAQGDLVSSVGRDGYVRSFSWKIEDPSASSKKVVWTQSFETSLPGAREHALLESGKIIVGDVNGRVLEVSH